MAKRKYESSVLVKRTKKKRKLTGQDKKIDYSDIPEFTDEELKKFKRVGRPIVGLMKRKAISIRIDGSVIVKLQVLANEKNIPYQSLINDILFEYVKKSA